MSPADSARLELAKRAYQAAQPSVVEVQTGVRRARISLRRPKQRRKGMLKGLVLVVLALGGLAYARPNALKELAAGAVPLLGGAASKQRQAMNSPSETARSEPQRAAPVLVAPEAPTEIPAETAPKGREAAKISRGTTKPSPNAPSARVTVEPAPIVASREESPDATPSSEAPVSEWGRVGQALARGDEGAALSALGKLSESEDGKTRDKADLGRAQLLMAHGAREEACSLARSLTRRRAGGHIERQAQILLKTCAR